MFLYKQEKYKNTVIETLISLFKTNGYDNVSIDDITKVVGIAKGTF